MLNDTIVAISTALKMGAVSIIRLSGDQSIEIANTLFSADLTKVQSHTITYGMIKDNDGNDVDEALVSVFKAPKSYTMEDVVEINCHGGVYITKKILSLCLAKGARLANPGEFTQRAYLNGRIDLSQAESINDMIQANNKLKANSALSGLKGSVTRLIDPLCEELVQIISNIEVNIDFPEYDDVKKISEQAILPNCKIWLNKIERIIKEAEDSVLIKNGINTVIIGKPNVGKSSLLNALLEEDKAIVTDIAGTTRDLVEGQVQCGDITLNLIDTAGIRSTEDTIEKIGIDKSIQALDKAQLVILVIDSSKDLDKEDQALLDLTKDMTRIVVYNKDDKKALKDVISISALNNNIDDLKKAISETFKDEMVSMQIDTLNNERQIGKAIEAKTAMASAIASIESGAELDLITIDLQQAYNSLKEILGEVSREDLLDEMFSRFCLGK